MVKRIRTDAADISMEYANSDSETDREVPAQKSRRKYDGAVKCRVKYKPSWAKDYPVKAVLNDCYSFFCIPRGKSVSCQHQALRNVKVHCELDTHRKKLEAGKKSHSIRGFLSKPGNSGSDVIKAEVMVTTFLVQHNLPIATADHLGPLFKEISPDSKIAAEYASGRTKTSAILNVALGPHCHKYLVEHCNSHPFSLGIDGSNDTGLNKMNPVTIRIFDINRSKMVTSHFFDMCVNSGVDGGKAATIFDVMDEKFTKDGIPWLNAISLSVDNTNAMIGCNNSIASHCKAKNQSIFIRGCPCHLAHLAATAANISFTEAICVNVEDVLINLYYWFDKSSKHKGKLAEYFEFCDQEYHQVCNLSLAFLGTLY